MKKYQLENEEVLIEFMDYGGIVTKMINKKTMVNYVLAYDERLFYQKKPYFLGATIGRNAGRTYPPFYKNHLNEQVRLETNEGRVHLHGGTRGMHQVYWEVEKITCHQYILHYTDQASSYEPMQLSLLYQLEENQFSIRMIGESEKPTVCNLTNHSYFNLNLSKKRSVAHHFLKMAPARLQLINEEYVPTEEYTRMTDPQYASFNFEQEKPIGDSFNLSTKLSKLCRGGIDLAYCFVEGKGNEPKVTLTNQEKTNFLKIYSNQEACVVYTLNKIEELVTVNEGAVIRKFGGITFEMQRKPNYVHQPNSLTEKYESYIIYEIM